MDYKNVENPLIKNLYFTRIPNPKKNDNSTKKVHVRGISNPSQNLPLLPSNKMGGIIIQTWQTKKEIPADITENFNLPIIVDRKKLARLPEMLSNKGELSEKEQKTQKFLEAGERLLVEKQLSITRRSNSISQNLLENSILDKKHLNDEKVNQTAITQYIVKENIPNTKALASSKKGPVSNIIDFTNFKKIDALTDNEFIYCKRVGNPIEFEECTYNQLKGSGGVDSKSKKNAYPILKKDELEYITVSKNTVLHFIYGTTIIYSVNEWRDFYQKFKRLMNIPLFKNYRMNKLFDLWRNYVKKHKKTFYTEKLKGRLHHIDISLLDGIKVIRKILKEMTNINIFKYEQKDGAITIIQFQEIHRSGLKNLDQIMEEYRDKIKNCILKACGKSYDTYKELKKITIEDNFDFKNEGEQKDKKESNSNKKDMGSFVQNFLKDTMPYAQDATRRTHYKKLLRYIRLIDFLFNEAKYKMIYNSLLAINKIYNASNIALSLEYPLIIFYVHPMKNHIKLTPHFESIEKAIFDEYLTEKIYTVICKKNFIEPKEFPNYMVCMEEVFETSVDQNHNLNMRIKEDPVIINLLTSIKEVMNRSYYEVTNYAQELLPLLNNYNQYETLDFNTFNSSKPEVLKEYLYKFVEEEKVVSQLKKKVSIGIFEFNLQNLIQMVDTAPQRWISTMRDLIPKIVINKLKELIKILNNHLKKLNVTPENVETFITLKKDVEEIMNLKKSIEASVQEIDDILLIIKSNEKEIKIPDYDIKLVKEKDSLFVDFQKKTDSVSYFIEMNLNKFRTELRNNIIKFDNEIVSMKGELNGDAINKYSKDTYQSIFELENKSVQIKKKVEKMNFLKQLERDIQMDDESSFENLENLVYEYELKSKMWYCLRDFQANTEKWKIQHILSINIENVEKELEEYADIAKIAANDLENTNIPEFLLSQTSTYKELIPALKSFQNPNVQEEKFRKEITQLLEQEIDFLNDPRTTLESLFNLNIPLHTPKIIEISNRANEEKVLKDKYHAIYKNYMEKKIPLNKYIRGAQQNEKSEKHYIKEEDIEIEYEYIDEKLLELQKMLLNPYCDIVRKDVVALVENYMKYLSFMDEYTRLQKYWFLSENYLQINQSELQKEFPVEIKKLSTIESQLKNSGKVKIIIKIKLVKDNNFVYKYNDFSHSKVIQTLKTLNIYYDEIYRAIEESLDKKRSEFSKYYFLSNEELLKIFSFPQNLDNLVNCISKLINGFKTIDFGAETDDTVKITTIDGEIIVFKIQKNKPQIKDYIEFIELEIEKKIKNSFRTCKKDIKENFKTDAKRVYYDSIKNKDNFGQIVFTYLYYLNCENIEKALTTQGDIFDKLLDIKFDSKERRNGILPLLHDNSLDIVERKKLLNIFCLENHFNELIKNLIRDDVNNVNDFGWVKYITYFIESEECKISHLNNKYDYGYEYVGLYNNFFIPQQTERVFVALSNNIFNKKPSFVYGLPETGKSETMNILSKMFGKSLITFECTNSMDEKTFERLLSGLFKSGNWICLDGIDSLPINMLSICAQKIINIYREIVLKSETKINKKVQIFCISNITCKSNISDNMKHYFRLVGVAVPELSYFINFTLRNLGIQNKSNITRKIKYCIEFLNTKINVISGKRIGLFIYNKFLKLFEKSIRGIKDTSDESIISDICKKCLEHSFLPILNHQETEETQRFLNNVFNIKDKSSNNANLDLDYLDELIDNVLKNFHFSNNNFKNQIKRFFDTQITSNYFAFVGESHSGKTLALNFIQQLSKILKQQNSSNLDINVLKIFPKAFEPKSIFTETNKYSRIQFYNSYFLQITKLLNEMEKKSDVKRKGTYESYSSTEISSLKSIKIIEFDGQVDSSWIDYLTLLTNENQTQFYSNGDTMFVENIKFLFETTSLSNCSPSLVSKFNIFYFDQKTVLTWENIFYNWINNNPKIIINQELKNYIRGLFENYFPKIYDFVVTNKTIAFNFKENYVMKNLISMFDSVLPLFNFEDKKIGRRVQNIVSKMDLIKKSSLSMFIFSSAWTLNFLTDFILRNKIEKYIGDLFKADDLKGPIFDYYIDDINHEYTLWGENIQRFLKPINKTIFNKVFIPHDENISYYWIVMNYLKSNQNVFYSGRPSSGKSLLLNTLLNNLDQAKFKTLRYLVNYNTNSRKIEENLIKNLSYIKRDLIGDSHDRKVVYFVDDLHLPKVDNLDVQTTHEYLRQIITTNSIYDPNNSVIKNTNKLNILACGNFSSYKNNENTSRFIHSFCYVNQNGFSDENNLFIFKITLENHLKTFIPNTASITTNQYIQTSLALNEFLNKTLKPSPMKLHYQFTIRDTIRVLQGILLYSFKFDNSEYPQYLIKIWFNENLRVYEDRLIHDEDKKLFRDNLLKIYNSTLKTNHKMDAVINDNILFACDIFNNTQEYVFYKDLNIVFNKIKTYLDTFNVSNKHKHIVLNKETLLLVLKILRVFMFEKGHLIMLGNSLVGKLSITNFASFVMRRKFVEIEENILEKVVKYEKSEKGDKNIPQTSLIEIKSNDKSPNLAFFVKYFRNIFNEIVYKNYEYVIFFNSKLMENDVILEQINNLINSREIFNYFGKISPEESKLNNDTPAEVVSEEKALKRLEKRMHFVMCAGPSSVAFNKLFYDYLYISKHSCVIYNDKWDDNSLLEISKIKLENLPDSPVFGSFHKLFLEIHQVALDLANKFNRKKGNNIQITSKNFVEMIENYKKYEIIIKNYLKNQSNKCELIATSDKKCKDVITSSDEEIEKNNPLKLEKERQIEEKRAESIKKKNFNSNLSNSILDDEKPLNQKRSELEKIDEENKEYFSEYNERITYLERSLNKYDKSELIDLRNTAENHFLTKYIMSQVFTLAGESSEWEFIKKNIDPKYIKTVLSTDFKNCPQNFVKIVKETVSNPEFNYENLPKLYIITKTLCEWFVAWEKYIIAYENNKEKFEVRRKVQMKIEEMEKNIAGKKENFAKVADQISEIERQISEIDRAKQKIQLIIDRRVNMKATFNALIEIVNIKMDFFSKKLEETSYLISLADYYTIFIASYLSYASIFTNSFRNKFKTFFVKKGDELGIFKDNQLDKLDFYTVVITLIEMNKDKKEFLVNLCNYDNYTRENLLIMNLTNKIPFIIDSNKIAKSLLGDFISRSYVKLNVIKPIDSNYMEVIEKSLKEGQNLIIEQVDDKVYPLLKNIVRENYFNSNKSVLLDYQNKEINEKFKLYFIKDKIDSKIYSKMWVETLVINFIPSRSQLKSIITKQLLLSENRTLWENYVSALQDLLRFEFNLKSDEDEIHNIFGQIDLLGLSDKLQRNIELKDELAELFTKHSGIEDNISTFKKRKDDIKQELYKYDVLSDDAAKIYKLISKFIYIDNIYNLNFNIYCNFINEYYKSKLLAYSKEYNTKENLLELIIFVYEKVALIYNSEDRKLLGLALIFHYLSEKKIIFKNFKSVLASVKNIYFDKMLDQEKYYEESPINTVIDNFTWNCLKEINDKGGVNFKKLFESIANNQEMWKNFLSSNPNSFIFPDTDLDKHINIFTKFLFFTLVLPSNIQSLINYFFSSIYGDNFKLPSIRLSDSLEVSNKKVVLLIDDSFISESEIIKLYQTKYNIEALDFFYTISLKSELSEDEMNKVISSIKNGALLFIREIQFAKQSLQKIFDTLEDQKTVIHENFRLVFCSRTNVILSNIIYENCLIINNNFFSITNLKDYVLDVVDKTDTFINENIINVKKNSLYARKIFFHLVIVHSVIKQYKFFTDAFYDIPFEFNKKDIYNCLYFVTNYLKTFDSKDNKEDGQNYLILINLLFESFYGNRLIYKEDFNRLMKNLIRFFEEDRFMNTDNYFSFTSNSKMIITASEAELSQQDIHKVLDEIPLEAYYELLDNINPLILKEKLNSLPSFLFNNFNILYSQKQFEDDIYTQKDDWNLHSFFARLKEIKSRIPGNVSFGQDEVSPSYLKQNKQGDLTNPLDESLKKEIESYNCYLDMVKEDVEYMLRIYNGTLKYSEDFSQIMQSIIQGIVPVNWMKSFKPLFSSSEVSVGLEVWLKELEIRIEKLKRWLLEGYLDVYHLPLFYNKKLFFCNLQSYFSKKHNINADYIKLKFALEKTHTIDFMDKKSDAIYIDGLSIENVDFDVEKGIITCPQGKSLQNLPLVRITVTRIDEEEEENLEEISTPIYEYLHNDIYENVEPLGYINLPYDSPKKEDFWLAKGVKISINREMLNQI